MEPTYRDNQSWMVDGGVLNLHLVLDHLAQRERERERSAGTTRVHF